MFAVRQLYSSPFLSTLPWFEGSSAHPVPTPAPSAPSPWHAGPFPRSPALSHAPCSSIRAPRPDLFGLSCREEVKGERLSPQTGTEGPAGVYTGPGGVCAHDHSLPLTHTPVQCVSQYGLYSGLPQEFSSATFCSASSFSPKLKMSFSPTGQNLSLLFLGAPGLLIMP